MGDGNHQDQQAARSGGAVHQADRQRLEETAVGMGMGVAAGGVADRLAGMDMGVHMPLRAVLVDMKMDAPATKRHQHMAAEQDNHRADGKFQRRLHALADGQTEQDRRAAYGEKRQAVAESPIGAAQHQLAAGAFSGAERRHGGEMVGLQGVLHAHQHAEDQDRPDFHAAFTPNARLRRAAR